MIAYDCPSSLTRRCSATGSLESDHLSKTPSEDSEWLKRLLTSQIEPMLAFEPAPLAVVELEPLAVDATILFLACSFTEIGLRDQMSGINDVSGSTR